MTEDTDEWLDEVSDCKDDCESCPEFGLCDEDLDDSGD